MMEPVIVTIIDNSLLTKIKVLEDISQQIKTAFVNHKPVQLILPNSQIADNDDSSLPRKRQIYNSVSSKPIELQRFAAYVKIIQILINHLKTTRNQTTIRDIYYQDVEMFNKSQQECKNMLVQIVEISLGWSLVDDLNIHPAQKGLVFGYNIFKSAIEEPFLIPNNYKEYFEQLFREDMDTSAVSVVVIIFEKDAIFESFCKHLLIHGVGVGVASKETKISYMVVTAKGYSDLLTLRFLNWLTTRIKTCQCIGFFDSDVYGINIFKQYKENINHPIQYAGVYLLESNPTYWLNINARDFSLMTNLTTKLQHIDPRCHRELTRGAYLMKKAEMNVVTNNYNEYIIKKVDTSL
ncbi:SPO11 [Candida oxycetoniae]|uniref:DNA topoisomerase (ATP-hydrolyzing) n=1 Tax=Candida oxycetoniae TaxID=497107 RepID=A0AAI9WZI0_9ASCO|nr:SPO11 [Candida oxycetoniae]KAI3406084.2 SPO11 [Candida oxycetoniae]